MRDIKYRREFVSGNLFFSTMKEICKKKRYSRSKNKPAGFFLNNSQSPKLLCLKGKNNILRDVNVVRVLVGKILERANCWCLRKKKKKANRCLMMLVEGLAPVL